MRVKHSIDRVLQIAAEVRDGSLSPITAGRLIVRENFLLIPTAVTETGRNPAITLTAMDLTGERAWKVMKTTNGNGILPVVRATNIPEVGIWAITDPNGSGQRLRVGGAGVTNENYTKFGYGISGWRRGTSNQHEFLWHEVVADYVSSNPDEIVGACDVVVRDSSFVSFPGDVELPGHYVSDARLGHETIASYPITGRALLQLPRAILPPAPGMQ